MLVSMNWINDYVDLKDVDIEKLIKRFTLSTAEVEDVFYYGKDIEKVIVGKIVELEKHPESLKLSLLKIDIGNEIKNCVCGAPNVRLGMKVAFVQEGGFVNGTRIEKSKVAGYFSEGMCCSASELGISADHSGIIEILEDVPLGTNIKDVYEIEDIIFEVDNKSLTNRPDLWGHYGIAREFSVLTKRPLKELIIEDIANYDDLKKVDISIIDTKNTLRYSSIIVENITKKISPINMRIRLFYCGLRGINLLTDLTNYIMLELGQPMHAFDANIVNKIEVKTYESEIIFKTLDNVDRKIDKSTTMICSNNMPVAIAGVMGGMDSEITDATTSVLLESANFDGISVRKTTTKIGLRTDASMRYEKIIDPEITKKAVERFVYLLKKIDKDCKIGSSFTDVYVRKYNQVLLQFDKKYVDRYTGIEITTNQIEETLKALGFKIKVTGENFDVVVPTWRATKDVTLKADIIEEITRIYGYDNFEIKTTLSPLYPVIRDQSKQDENYAKDLLVEKFQLNEVHSYIWCDTKKFKNLKIEIEDNIKLCDTSITENEVLRNSLIPSLVCFVEENKAFKNEFGIFEIGKAVEGILKDDKCDERKKLAIVLFSKEKNEKDLFFKLRDIIITLSKNLKHEAFEFLNIENLPHKWMHPVNSSHIVFKGEVLGFISVLNPTNQQEIDKKAAIITCEIDLDKFKNYCPSDIIFKEPSKFPGIDIDLSLIIKPENTFGQIEKIAKSLNCEYLNSISVIDIYEDIQKSMTIRLKFVSNERTLNMNEISIFVEKIISELEKENIMLKRD